MREKSVKQTIVLEQQLNHASKLEVIRSLDF